MAKSPVFGILGGTGFYDEGFMRDCEKIRLETPFGSPSGEIVSGRLGSEKVFFLPRHGRNHRFPPHLINYRANIWALKKLGVRRVVSPASVGGLKPDKKIGDLVFCDQFLDRTWGRESSFYSTGMVCHVNVSEPFCPQLRRLAVNSADDLGVSHHNSGTYVCVQGPRFSTDAEIALYKNWGCDVVGMTLVPEAVLAREAELCYLNISLVTNNYCAGCAKPNAGEIRKIVAEKTEELKKLVARIVEKAPGVRECGCGKSLQGAFI